MDRIPTKGTVPVKEISIRQGGTGANISKIAAILGVDVKFISKVSKNFPREFIDDLKNSGVKLELEIEGDQGPVCYIVEDSNEEIAFMYQGPMERPGKIYEVESKYIHFSTGNPEWVLNIMKKGKGFKVFDPGQEVSYRWNNELLLEASRFSDLVIVNEYENKFIEKFDFKEKIVTLGSKGCLFHDEVIPSFNVDVKSKVGAGDAFRSGFYFGLMNGYDFEDACMCGNLVASLHISGNSDKLNILKSKKSCKELYV